MRRCQGYDTPIIKDWAGKPDHIASKMWFTVWDCTGALHPVYYTVYKTSPFSPYAQLLANMVHSQLRMTPVGLILALIWTQFCHRIFWWGLLFHFGEVRNTLGNLPKDVDKHSKAALGYMLIHSVLIHPHHTHPKEMARENMKIYQVFKLGSDTFVPHRIAHVMECMISAWLICATTSTRMPTRRTTSRPSTETSPPPSRSSTTPRTSDDRIGFKRWVFKWPKRSCWTRTKTGISTTLKPWKSCSTRSTCMRCGRRLQGCTTNSLPTPPPTPTSVHVLLT